jgi:four helix bundle protein
MAVSYVDDYKEMKEKILSYKDLEVWKNGVKLAKDIYWLTETFLYHELYALTSQLRRAAVSVSSNIAEGYVKNSTKEFVHFLYISLGSLAEIDTQLQLAKELNYTENTEELQNFIEMQMQQIRSFINALKKNINKLITIF